MEGRAGWAHRVRDGVLLAIGSGMVLAETVGSVAFGHPVDPQILGAGLVILGVIPRLPNGNGKP